MRLTTRELIERFTTEAITARAIVYEAKDADDVNNYILKLAQERQVKRVVKSKSRLAEEIGLREYLEKNGIEVTETDLGDWITQLAGGGSLDWSESARDKTIQEIAKLVSKATNEELEPDPPAIFKAARRALRPSYITADMGISGADMGIAETGTLVMLCDEGNTRLVAVLPPIHVTLVDSDGLVFTLDDAVARLKSLSGSKTGRKLPSYVTYLTGRNTTGDIPGALMARAQGPAEEHIVLVSKAGGVR